MSSRPLSLPAALALAAIGLTGCGGSSSPRSAAPASPSPSPTPAPLTSPATTAAAGRINLVAGDLPGFTASPADNSTSAAQNKAEKGLARCVGASAADPAADITSDDFNKGTTLPLLTISSDVSFVTDAAQVKSDLAAFAGSKAPGCISTFFGQALAQEAAGATFAKPAVTRISPSSTGTDGAFGFRMASSVSAGPQHVPITFDLLGFGKGRTEVSLLVIGVGTAVPEAQRDALYAKLVQRASANAL